MGNVRERKREEKTKKTKKLKGKIYQLRVTGFRLGRQVKITSGCVRRSLGIIWAYIRHRPRLLGNSVSQRQKTAARLANPDGN